MSPIPVKWLHMPNTLGLEVVIYSFEVEEGEEIVRDLSFIKTYC